MGIAVPASAQGLYVGVGPGGVGVGVTDYWPYYGGWGGPYYRHHHRWGAPGYAYYGSPHYYSPGYAYGYSSDGWGY